jgi:hypothetical protein
VTASAPAQTIRRYLDGNGNVEVPVHNLLSSWHLREPTQIDRQQIVAELAEVGVGLSRPLSELSPDEPVTLALRTDARPIWETAVPDVPPPGPSPSSGGSRRGRWRIVAIGVAALLAAAGAAAGTFFVGQGTRQSEDQVNARLQRLAAHDKRVYTQQAQAALKQQKQQLTGKFRQQRQEAVTQAEERGRSVGYSSGQQAGYSSGKSEGYDQGHAQGEATGYADGFDEGTCYTPVTFEYVC